MLRISTSFACTAGLLAAQAICPTVTPAIVPPGAATAILVTVTDTTGLGFQHQGSCVATSIHAGMPFGTAVPLPVTICSTAIVTVPPYGSATKTFNLPASLASGHYFARIRWRPVGASTLLDSWVSFVVQDASAPTLTALTAAQTGQVLSLGLSAATAPGGIYVAAASLTTDVGIPLGGGLHVALDYDLVFQLSFPVPHGGLFNNFLGPLDAAGMAPGLDVVIPPGPLLAGLPLHVQAAILPVSGPTLLSNCLNLCIAP
jgi:hypothetical protein